MTDLDAALEQLPVIGILRGCPPRHVDDVALAAKDAGLGALEITMHSEDPFAMVRALVKRYPELSIGVGTVHSVREVEQAADAGARYVVSPHFDSDIVAATHAAGMTAMPGAATPTEVQRAIDAGAGLVKVFPARELGGPAYISAIIGPLGYPALVPTGGVDESNAAAFLAAGSAALGIGAALFPEAALESGDSDEIGRRCHELVASIR